MATTRRSRAPRSKKSPSPAVQDDVTKDVGMLSTRGLELLYPGLGDGAQTAELLKALEAGWDELLA